MFFLWVLTVWKLEKRLAAISFVVIPRAMSLRISVSVFVSNFGKCHFKTSLLMVAALCVLDSKIVQSKRLIDTVILKPEPNMIQFLQTDLC